MAAQGQHMPAQGQQLCCTGPPIMLQRGIAQGHMPAQSFHVASTWLHRACNLSSNYAAQGLQLCCTGAAIIPHMVRIINIWWPWASKTSLYAWISAPHFDMSRGPASPLFKHLVTATKHRYTRGFGHVQKRAHRVRETIIFVRFAHRARDLLVFNVKMWFSVGASFRGAPIYIYIYIYICYAFQTLSFFSRF